VVAGDLEDGWIGVCSPSGHKACGKTEKKTRENAIVEYLDYQIPVTQLNGDMHAAKRD